MGLSTYAELKEAVYDWLLRDSNNDLVITNDRVETYIALAEAELSRELKIRELEAEDDTLVTVGGEPTIDLPDDYRSMIFLEHDSAPKKLEYLPENMASRLFEQGATGRPINYSIQGNKLRFYKIPDGAYGLFMRYYKGITALSDSNTTNEILSKYPDVYLYGTLCQALFNLDDTERFNKINPKFINIVERINLENRNSQIPSGARMRSYKPIA